MDNDKALKEAFARIKQDIAYVHSFSQSTKQGTDNYLNYLINNQNNTSEKIHHIEQRMARIEEQLMRITQFLQKSPQMPQEWLVVDQR